MTALAAVLVGLAAWLMFAPAPEPRLQRVLARAPAAPAARQVMSMRTATAGATTLAALGALLVFGGVLGIALAVACVIVVPRLARSMESRSARVRRGELARQAPILADLLAATMASGAPMRPALAAVIDAIGDPAREVLRPVMSAVDLGADPRHAWQPLIDDPVLAPMAAAVIRSAETGAPLSSVLSRIADDLRRERQTAIEVAARSAGVKAVAPLAACFLPAFLLLGVVPVVVSLAGEVLM